MVATPPLVVTKKPTQGLAAKKLLTVKLSVVTEGVETLPVDAFKVNAPAPVKVAASVVPPYHLKKLVFTGTLFHNVLASTPVA
jgi:hypothetical protein